MRDSLTTPQTQTTNYKLQTLTRLVEKRSISILTPPTCSPACHSGWFLPVAIKLYNSSLLRHSLDFSGLGGLLRSDSAHELDFYMDNYISLTSLLVQYIFLAFELIITFILPHSLQFAHSYTNSRSLKGNTFVLLCLTFVLSLLFVFLFICCRDK